MKNGILQTILCRFIKGRMLPIASIFLALAGILFVNTNTTHSSDELMSHNESDATSEYTGSDYKGNYVYGGAMNLAWNELNENILHEKLKLNITDKKALEMVDKFNKAIFTKNDLDEASYYVKSGCGQKTVDTINRESRAKFPDKSFGDLKLTLQDKDIIAYAYFLKKVEYVTPFVIDNVSFMSERVKGFHAKTSPQRENVEVLKYWDDNKFIIRLRLKDDSDELILAKGFDMSEPKGIVDEIRKYDTQNLPTMGEDDLFEMPKLHLDYRHDYNEVIKKYLANKGFETYRIEAMYENIKFDMDEKGARVENEAVLGFKNYSSMPIKPPQIRQFILDKPFWVVMKRKYSKNPYFILGVNNTELMEKNNEITSTSGSNNDNAELKLITDLKNNPESHTTKEKLLQPKEAAAPILKIMVLEEKKKEKVPVEGAGVYLDGKEIGTTDKSGELFIKETIENYHILEVKKLGYFTFKENIEISEYAEDKTVILSPGIASFEGSDNGEDEGVQETQEQVTETPEQESVTPEQDVISERKTEKVHEQQTDKKTEKPILKISVLGDTGMERVPVKGAKILMNGYLCGETDKDGLFTKRERVGEHTLKVEKNGFYPVSKKIEFNEYSDSYEIVLKKKQVKQ